MKMDYGGAVFETSPEKNHGSYRPLAVMVAVAGYLNYLRDGVWKARRATLGKVQEGAADEGAVSTPSSTFQALTKM